MDNKNCFSSQRFKSFILKRGLLQFTWPSVVWGTAQLSLVGASLVLLLGPSAIADSTLQIRNSRWLEIQQVVGRVLYQQGDRAQPAQIGGRLQSVGEGIATGAASRSVLSMDTGIGLINIAENTELRVNQLQQLPDGGRVTRLTVTRGQANLRVRSFTHPTSELEIQTPAGWSGVRGTEFGVTVQPDGKTGVATLEGKVVAVAQGQTVDVNAGFQSLIVPGEPPAPATPISTEPPRLQLEFLSATSAQTARIVGRIDPVNLLILDNTPQTVDRTGRFELTVPLPPNRRITVKVVTPLGNQQTYELAVPRR